LNIRTTLTDRTPFRSSNQHWMTPGRFWKLKLLDLRWDRQTYREDVAVLVSSVSSVDWWLRSRCPVPPVTYAFLYAV